jgi:hypothetical protein
MMESAEKRTAQTAADTDGPIEKFFSMRETVQ